MSIELNEFSAQVLALVKDRLHEWRDCTSPVWHSTWPIFERLIARHDEMKPVYGELAERGVAGPQLWNLLEQFIFAGSFSTEVRHASLRADHAELTDLNEAISEGSSKLAAMIERRSEILNRSGHFRCERIVSLTELIDEAGKENGHYRSFLQPELQALTKYDLKYWPSVADILHVIGLEEVEITFSDVATEAIINARRPSLTDYFRELFDNINELKKGYHYALPRAFKLSDRTLATVCNITRNLAADELIDASYVKRTRHRLKDLGFNAAW